MSYRERLWVPASWWILLILFAVSMVAAFGVYLGLAWGVAVGLGTVLIFGAIFLSASITITVSGTEIGVGRAVIESRYLSGAEPLDAERARLRRGPNADARAYLVLRPYIATAVELTLDDDADPVPYWLVASRRPGAFARAVADSLSDRVTG